jgi:hypothetical protein
MRCKTNRSIRTNLRSSNGRERGEGVISLAIGVLVMAVLGVAMWAAFSTTLSNSTKAVDKQVQTISGE